VAQRKLKGTDKAALFLLSLGEEVASEVFSRLNEEELKRLGETMAGITQAPEEEAVELVFTEFRDILEGRAVNPVSGDLFLRRTLFKVLDGQKAASFLEDVQAKKAPRPFERLRQLEPSMLANFIRTEHPQTIALVVAHLSHQAAAQILKLLPEEVQAEVVMRIAKLDNVPAEVIADVEEVLEREIASIGKIEHRKLGGIQAAAEIMNQLDQGTEREVMACIEEERQELAEEIRQLMFVFEDLNKLDDRGIRLLLKEVSNDDLVLALKTASEGLKQKIFANLSERAAEMLREDIEIMGPARLSDVEQAQQMIIRTARRLEAEGKLVVSGRGGEDVLV
jgi:flagellar motor switch protein FliG